MKKEEEDPIAIRIIDKHGNPINISRSTLKAALDLMRTLNNSYRQRIISLLELEDELSVTEIYIKLKMDQSVVSQHLSMLRRFDLLLTRRSGKHVLYSLNRDRFLYLSEQLRMLLKKS